MDAWPRLLDRKTAAAYLGMAVSRFEKRVRNGDLPKPVPFGNPQLWDRAALDLALDRLSHVRRNGPAPAQNGEAVALGAINAGKNALRHRAA